MPFISMEITELFISFMEIHMTSWGSPSLDSLIFSFFPPAPGSVPLDPTDIRHVSIVSHVLASTSVFLLHFYQIYIFMFYKKRYNCFLIRPFLLFVSSIWNLEK